jgi:hypothetical protein
MTELPFSFILTMISFLCLVLVVYRLFTRHEITFLMLELSSVKKENERLKEELRNHYDDIYQYKPITITEGVFHEEV